MQLLVLLSLAFCSMVLGKISARYNNNGARSFRKGIYTRTTGEAQNGRHWTRKFGQRAQYERPKWRRVNSDTATRSDPFSKGSDSISKMRNGEKCQDSATQRICTNNLNRVRREGATCFKDAPIEQLTQSGVFWSKRRHQIRYIQRLLKQMCCATCVEHELHHLQKIRERKRQQGQKQRFFQTKQKTEPRRKVMPEQMKQPFPRVNSNPSKIGRSLPRQNDRNSPRSGVYYIYTKRIYLDK